MLHGVISAKYPQTKASDLKTMAVEGINGLLEASYVSRFVVQRP